MNNDKIANNTPMKPNAVWTALIALLLSLILVACSWDAFKSRKVEFRYRVVDRQLAPLHEKSYVFFKSVKDPVYSGRQRGKVDAGQASADGFVDVFVPGDATDFRLDVVFRDVPDLFWGRKELVLEVDVSGYRREIRLEFRKEKPFYAWASFAARDFTVCRFNAWTCLSVLCTSWVFMFMLVSAFRRMTPLHGNILFVCLFAAVCALPSVKMDKSDASDRENRRLERFPDGGLAASEGPSAWCKQFEAAFADRFFCRYWLMDVHSAIVDFFDDRGNAKVHVGRDGWLFLKQTLGDFSNAAQMYDQRTMERIFGYLDSLSGYAKRNGKKFVFFIAPDKCRVYPEKVRFLKKVRPDSESRTERLVAYLKECCDFPVIYPREYFVGLKDADSFPLYYKDDTHWTYKGAYLGGYLPIMDALNLSGKKVLSISDFEVPHHWGDLRRMLGDSPSKVDVATLTPLLKKGGLELVRPSYDANDSVQFKSDRKQKGDVEGVVYSANPDGKYKLYCIRDSFCSDLMPYFARSFEKCIARHVLRGVRPEDKKEMDESDVILLEISERDLRSLSTMSLPIQFRREVR